MLYFPMIAGAFGILLLLGLCVHHASDLPKGKMAYRFATGLLISTGKDVPDPNARVWTRWTQLYRWQRFAIRWGLITGYFTVAHYLHKYPVPVFLVLRIAAFMAAGLLAFKLGHHIKTRGHRRNNVRPLAKNLGHALSHHASYLTPGMVVAPNINKVKPGGLAGKNRLPGRGTNSTRQRTLLLDIWANHFGVSMDELTPGWRTRFGTRWMEVRRMAQPPANVLLDDHTDYMDTLPMGQYFMGLGTDEMAYVWNTRIADPHGKFQAPTTRGKSEAVSAIIAQALRRSEDVRCADAKGDSQGHFKGHPNFTIADDPADPQAMERLIVKFADDLKATRTARRNGAKDDGRHHLLVIEEINVLFSLLGGRRNGKLARDNPVAKALNEIVNLGARYHYRVLITGQDLSDEATFGAKDRFGMAFMMGYSSNQWMKIVQREPVPPEPVGKGRCWAVKYGEPQLIQFVWPGHNDPADEEASKQANRQAWMNFALNGREPVLGVPEPAAEPVTELEPVAEPMAEPAPELVLAGGPAPEPEPELDEGNADDELAEMTHIVSGNKGAGEFLGAMPGTFKKRWEKYPIPADAELEPITVQGNVIRRWIAADLLKWWNETGRSSSSTPGNESNRGKKGGNSQ